MSMSMEVSVNAVMNEFSGGLARRLRALVEDQLAVRIAELDRRERELDDGKRVLALREEAVARREAALQKLDGTLVPQPCVSPCPSDAPTPARARPASATTAATLFRPPAPPDSSKSEATTEVLATPLQTVSAGAASELKDMFEKKALAARKEASPQRRHSWRPVHHELPNPDGNGAERYRVHEAPFRRVSAGPAGAPPLRRTLEELLKADEERQRSD
eukprot:CAMPEP_0179119050 /NCGR_PEP_ID=MMETSP0796-20121207/56025_1 /TAXON_ID=73915 /ORGANISM="Pyrodinium bahamense, Strain pbaha01" /LENGTH=217 /DNA_ID=CAMNT_0020817539 /DNA_START=50 /DNA_END=703 /DNA_ORIENTATION=-